LKPGTCVVLHFLITFALEPELLLAAFTGETRLTRSGSVAEVERPAR
jgi:hypothetical protein